MLTDRLYFFAISVETKNPQTLTFCINLNLDQINSSGQGMFLGSEKSEFSGKLPYSAKSGNPLLNSFFQCCREYFVYSENFCNKSRRMLSFQSAKTCPIGVWFTQKYLKLIVIKSVASSKVDSSSESIDFKTEFLVLLVLVGLLNFWITSEQVLFKLFCY